MDGNVLEVSEVMSYTPLVDADVVDSVKGAFDGTEVATTSGVEDDIPF